MFAAPLSAQNATDGVKFLDAVKKRDGTVVTDLLNEPGSTVVNSRDITSGESGLHLVTQRRDITWIKFLLSKGANPNVADKNGVVPLQIASQLGFIEGIEALLDRGAEVDVTNAAGETPLISAVHRRDIAMVRLLVSKGANPDRSDNSGRTARDYAMLMGAKSQVLEEIQRSEREMGERAATYGPA
ncbi:ankyrin repeat domain-containing protein [Qipengyuania marisflavi]|nr:ankyrin repeat domain-containing protein [Qipengyuania marisflavi]